MSKTDKHKKPFATGPKLRGVNFGFRAFQFERVTTLFGHK